MAVRKRTPEEYERRAKILKLLRELNIGSMDDIHSMFKDIIAEFLENGLEAELDGELGHSKYDCRNKNTDNSRNVHSSKTLRTTYGEVDISVPRDRKGEFEPQIVRKNQTSVSQDIEEKILLMYAKGMSRACEVLSVSYPRLPLLWQLILMWRRLFARRRHVSTIGYRPLSVNFSI